MKIIIQFQTKVFTVIFLFLIPMLGFCQDSEFWGMTSAGGEFNQGVIFKTDHNGNNLAVVHEFHKNPGARPEYTNLCEASNGKLYGMTRYGGEFNKGVLFEFNPTTNTYIDKVDFAGSTNGEFPLGSLFLASDEKFYGMTSGGGLNNSTGVIFSYDPINNIYSKKVDFDNAINKGSIPFGSFIEEGGKLYGMTPFGGANGHGVIFEYNLNNTITKIHDFDGTNTGSRPYGSLTAINGILYGMTNKGGLSTEASNHGILFEYNLSTNTFSTKHVFDRTTGSQPYGSLIEFNDKLYGMAFAGGSDFPYKGVLFEYNINTSALVVKLNFADGAKPYGDLALYNGKFYGLTSQGGTNDRGIMFEFDPINNTQTKLVNFDGISNFNLSHKGSYPRGSLMHASSGKFYGLTNQGGIYDDGVLFEYDITSSTYTKKIDLNYSKNGTEPFGDLTPYSNNKLYGITRYGGNYNDGVLFEFDSLNDTYTKKVDFEKTSLGEDVRGKLVEANGKLYGLTRTGGANNIGTIFEYDPLTNLIIKKHDFITATGGNPQTSMIKASNGKLYGNATFRGPNINKRNSF